MRGGSWGGGGLGDLIESIQVVDESLEGVNAQFSLVPGNPIKTRRFNLGIRVNDVLLVETSCCVRELNPRCIVL